MKKVTNRSAQKRVSLRVLQDERSLARVCGGKLKVVPYCSQGPEESCYYCPDLDCPMNSSW
jgi:hypothetical protein